MMGTALKINTEKIRLLQSFNDLLYSIESVERNMNISFKKEKQKMSEYFNLEIFAQFDNKVNQSKKKFQTFSKKRC
jgi:hypothetical protein